MALLHVAMKFVRLLIVSCILLAPKCYGGTPLPGRNTPLLHSPFSPFPMSVVSTFTRKPIQSTFRAGTAVTPYRRPLSTTASTSEYLPTTTTVKTTTASTTATAVAATPTITTKSTTTTTPTATTTTTTVSTTTTAEVASQNATDVTRFLSVGSTQLVAIVCAETYNETVRLAVPDTEEASPEKFAQSLVVSIADVAGVNESRVVNAMTFENPVNGSLVIQFGIEDGYQTRATQAVSNLKHRLLHDERRIRRNVDVKSRLMSDLNNQTITPTHIYNWTVEAGLDCVCTADGPCPGQRCVRGDRCNRHPDGRFYCRPVTLQVTLPVTSKSESCVSQSECIIPVLVAAGGLFLYVVVVLVICLLRQHHQQKPRSTSVDMLYSQTAIGNPMMDLQTVETHSVTASTASTFVHQPPSPTPPRPEKQSKLRKWTRIKLQKRRRHLDPVATDENGYPSAAMSALDVDTDSTCSDISGLPFDQFTMTSSHEILSY